MLPLPAFHWLWTSDILADYERGALAIEQDTRIMRRAAFDRTGFQLLLAALRLHPSVPVSVTTLREVRRQISQAAHARQRDLDDAIYLACALDGEAQVLTSNDAALLGLGSPYAGVRIVPWQAFVEELRARGLITPDT
jgi:predicted nucleic acid-binding protein